MLDDGPNPAGAIGAVTGRPWPFQGSPAACVMGSIPGGLGGCVGVSIRCNSGGGVSGTGGISSRSPRDTAAMSASTCACMLMRIGFISVRGAYRSTTLAHTSRSLRSVSVANGLTSFMAVVNSSIRVVQNPNCVTVWPILNSRSAIISDCLFRARSIVSTRLRSSARA